MRRGRGKGKKQTSIDTRTDAAAENNEEEKIPASKRRGRPQKPLTDEINEDDDDGKIIEGDEKNPKSPLTSKNSKGQITVHNWKKRKRSSSAAVKENISDSVKDESSFGSSKLSDDSNLIIKTVGFRANGNRRKSSRPHRAAEVGVECN